MIACFGETTGGDSLQKVLEQMQNSEEGANILSEKPRINTKTIDLDALKKMPNESFGYCYSKFLDDNVNSSDNISSCNFLQFIMCIFLASDTRFSIQCEVRGWP